MSTESTSPKPKKKTTKKSSKKSTGTDVDVIFDLAIKGMLVIQITLAITAFLNEIDLASDFGTAGTFTFATLLSYVAIVAIVYSLSLIIGDESKSPITRIFAFVYYIVFLSILFQAATDPAGGTLGLLGGA